MNNIKSEINKLLAYNKIRLTYNIIEYIFIYINIDYINNIIKALGIYIDEGIKKKLKYIKKNIRPIFNNFINNIKKLLNIIYILKIIFFRSWLSNFFKLKYNSRVFNYNFYIKNNIYYIIIFIIYIINIGIY